MATIGYYFEPSGFFPLVVDLRHHQIDENSVCCRTMPIAGIQRNHRRIAWMQLLDLFTRQFDGESRNHHKSATDRG
jgi:hypothetical protein